MEHFRTIVKFVIGVVMTVTLIGVLYVYITKVSIPKWTSEWRSTTIVEGFYDLPIKSTQFLILGDSHAVTGISPMRIFEKYGLTGYSCATESQPIQASYYWLKEANRTQNPSVLIMDADQLFWGDSEETEAFYHKAYDYMRYSEVKKEAIIDHANGDSEVELSYFFPLKQYHERWKELTPYDFRYLSVSDKSYANLGYKMNAGGAGIQYTGVMLEVEEPAQLVDESILYFEKIHQYCVSNSITLLLVKTPCTLWNNSKHWAVQGVADKLGITFLDFNSSQWMITNGFEYEMCGADAGHLNIQGANIVSDFIGEYLIFTGVLQADDTYTQNPYYQELLVQYKKNEAMADLAITLDADEYLEKLKIMYQDYDVFVMGCCESLVGTSDGRKDALRYMGLETHWEDFPNEGYLAVINHQGEIEEQHGLLTQEKILELSGCKRCTLISKGLSAGAYFEACLDDEVYEFVNGGINIIVYDPINQEIVTKRTIY